MLLLLLVLRDPVLIISYLIYYIYCIVGYDAGGYIVAGGVTSCSGGLVGVAGFGSGVGCYCYVLDVIL